MNIPKHEADARLAGIVEMIAEGRSFNEAVARFQCSRNNLREFAIRRGVVLPDAWKARPTKKHSDKATDEQPFCLGCTLPADRLTDEEKEAAERFGIAFERAAWLITCEFSGNARGLAVTR